MKDIVINKRIYNRIASFSKLNPNKEACAFLFGKRGKNSFLVQKVVQVRNINRIGTSFAISKTDFDLYYTNRLLLGLYHSHLIQSHISKKDEKIFKKFKRISIQIIGAFKKNRLELIGYSNESKPINLNII